MKQLQQLCFILLVFAGRATAAPIVSGSSGNWNNPSTWVGGVVPSAGDNVTIANGHTVAVDANASCASVLIGNGLRNQSTTLTINAGTTLTSIGNITIVAPASGTTDNTLNVADGTVICPTLVTSATTSDLLRCIVSINTGTLTCTANFSMNSNVNRSKLIFTGAGLLQIAGIYSTLLNGQFTAGTGTIEYNGAARGQSILPLDYYTLKCSGALDKLLSANTVLKGDLQIAGSCYLDISAGNYSLSVAGSWIVTTTNGNPFVERKGTVTFNGTSGLQLLTTPLVGETFYNLIINNTAGNVAADIQFNKNCYVSQTFTQLNGKIDLNGKGLFVASANGGGFTNCALTGGGFISSATGAQISFIDILDSTVVNINGISIGNAAFPVALTINTGRMNLENVTLYGTGNFTRTLNYDDITNKGGNKFYNAVTYTAGTTSGNWYTGAGNGALPDSFFARVDFNNLINTAGTKFIVGANSLGNYYADSVSISNKSAGAILFGSNSGAASGTSSSHFFNNYTDIRVTGSGDIILAGGQSLLPSSITFNKKLRIGGGPSATGNIYIGTNTSGSTITITSTGQLITGDATGPSTFYFYNVTQNGSLPQSLTNATTANSKIIVGSISSPCTWNGPVTLTAAVLDLAYNTFNGSSSFTLSNPGITPQSCTGGNRFASGTLTGFNNNGAAPWYIATAAGDDYNGDVTYRINSTGGLYPAYNSNCTYAGNIIILPGSDSVSFAASTNGCVTVDGNVTGFFTNNTAKASSIKRFTINKTGCIFALNRDIYMPAGGVLTLLSGRVTTSIGAMLILQDETCTVTATTAASTSFVEGPLRIDVSSNALQTLHFPIGKATECRPVDLTIQHNSNTTYSYTAEMVMSSANALGWATPASVYSMSTGRWWDITRTLASTGAAAPTAELVTSPLPVVSFYYGFNDRANIPANLTICKNTYNAPTSWIDIGCSGATNTIGKVTSTSSPTAFNSFSRFALGFYGIPTAPTANDSSRCGTGTVTISATPIHGEAIDWYAAATGGTALATGSNTFTTPSIAVSTTYYAEARNTRGYTSTTRTAVNAVVYNTAAVTSFSPTSGEAGTIVIITGSNFTNITGVSFGGSAAASFTVNSLTQITAVVGAGGTGSVAVINNCGAATKTGFTYQPITVWTGAVNNNWALAGNWDDGVPTSIHCAIIPNVATLPLISSNQTVKSIIVQTGAGIDIAAGNNLSVKDSITNDANITGGGAVVMNGTASQLISGTGSYNNLTLNNSSGAVIKNGAGNQVNITGSYTPTSGILTTNNNLTIKSTAGATGIIASGAAAGGYINGKVTLERYVPARRSWRLINFPVTAASVPDINTALQEGAGGNAASNPNPGYGTHITGGAAVAGFDQNASNSPSMKEWNGAAWQGITSTNQPVSNQLPYFIFVRGSRANNLSAGTAAAADNTTLRLSANVKQGNQLLAVSGTGWQLAGNPFPSIINLDAVATNNSSIINRNFKYWDPKLGGTNNVGGYVTASYNGFDYDFTPTPVSQLSEYAQPFSGFYVDAVSTGSITVAESYKCNCGNGNVFRPAPSNNSVSKLYINLRSVNTDGTKPVVDGTMASFSNSYSNSIDQYDATKLFNSIAENISIATADTKISIERRNAIVNNDTVYLDISNMRVRNYQLEIKPENFDSRVTAAYIEDSYTAQRTAIDLLAGSTYDFSMLNIPAAYARNRFRIVFEKDELPGLSKSISEPLETAPEKESIKLLQNPVVNNNIKLVMTAKQKGKYSITIINKDGKQIMTKQFDHDGIDAVKTIAVKKYIPGGVQIVTVKDPSGKSTSFNILIQ